MGISMFGLSFLCPCLLPRRVRAPLANLHAVVLLTIFLTMLCGLVYVVVTLLGMFVAFFLLTIIAQRIGQRCVEQAHLRDVAERFAVDDRVKGARKVELEEDVDLERFAASQEEIREHLGQEIRVALAAQEEEEVDRA